MHTSYIHLTYIFISIFEVSRITYAFLIMTFMPSTHVLLSATLFVSHFVPTAKSLKGLSNNANPANIYLFKVNNKNKRKGVKYVQI